MIETALNPLTLLAPGRTITGISAILLPFNEDGSVDWDGFCAHVARTAHAPRRSAHASPPHRACPAPQRPQMPTPDRAISSADQSPGADAPSGVSFLHLSAGGPP